MTATIEASSPDRYQPAPVKKRRAASIVTAVVAGVAGLAIAATFSYFQQNGSGSYNGDTTPPIEDKVVATDLTLGTLQWSGATYAADDSPSNVPPGDVAPPANATSSSFTITNKNTADRQVVRLINVVPDSPDNLYKDVWVRIEREDPTGANGPAKFLYFGPLSQLSNIYMGNIVKGGVQVFDVKAWTANSQPAGTYATAFKVNYSVYTGAFETTPTAP